MSSDFSKRDQDDLLFLLEELSEVKDVLREVSQKMLRIERRVKAVLPQPQRSPRRMGAATRQRPPMDDRAAQQLIDRLKEGAARGEQIERRLYEHPIKPDLQAIAKMLGMTNVKLPPKDELIRRIASRLRQGASVSMGIRNEPGVVR